jgi:RNA recognition motif-containing protein
MDCKVFVGNVPFDCTNQEFRDCFKNIEGYVCADLISMRGFGFVEVSTNLNRNNILLNNNYFIRNRKLRLSPYENNTKDKVEKSSYIKLENISPNISREDIIEEFNNLCTVGKCFIDMNRETGERLTTGLVEVFDAEVIHQLLSLGNIIMKDNSELLLKPFNTIVKKKKLSLNKFTKDEYYEIYNAGRNAGLIEGTRIKDSLIKGEY